MIKLESLNVKELSLKEKKETEGGLFWLYFTFFAIGLLYGLGSRS